MRFIVLFLWVGCSGQAIEEPSEAAAVAETPPADAPPKRSEKARKRKGSVSFVEPANGATVTSPVHVKFAIEGKTVEKAGEVVEGTGHHHVIVDGRFIEKGKPVPVDATHIHYGGGQLEADIPLEAGEHTLTMQFANGAHISYGEAFSTTITITVE